MNITHNESESGDAGRFQFLNGTQPIGDIMTSMFDSMEIMLALVQIGLYSALIGAIITIPAMMTKAFNFE